MGDSALAESDACGEADFLHASILEVDWGDADIVFSTNIMFPNSLLEDISTKARRTMKPGSCYVANHPVAAPGCHRLEISQRSGEPCGFETCTMLKLRTSWDQESNYSVQVATGDLTSGRDAAAAPL